MKKSILLSLFLVFVTMTVTGGVAVISSFEDNLAKAQKGDATAQNNVGVAYETGNGVAKDLSKAVYWYRKAADQGESNAQSNLGLCYKFAKGVAKDMNQAFYWFKKSAEQGNATGAVHLGECYYNGEGVTKDLSQAFYWVKKSADKGNATGMAWTGFMYYNGYGTNIDYTQALYWYKKGAEGGDDFAKKHLAEAEKMAGQKGQSATATQQQTTGNGKYQQYIAKAQAGDAEAQCYVGVAYYEGDGIGKNYYQAFSWFRKAANQGNAWAQSWTGRCYYMGNGVTKDYGQALYWYKKAAEKNDAYSQEQIGECYYNGYGVTKDYGQALYWFKKGAQQNEVNSIAWVGFMYFNGYGVAKDLEQAVYWYKKAADKGNDFAQKNLAQAEDMLRKQNLTASNNNSRVSQQQQQQQVVKEKVAVEEATPVVVAEVNVDKNIPVAKTADKNTFAVIIGNERYKNEADVPYAENDARMFKEYVQKTLGVPEKQIKMVIDAGLNDLRHAIRWLSQAMDVTGGKGRAIFYYAGHGIPDEASKTAFLLPADGFGSDVESGYALSRLYEELSKMPAERTTVFLDACFSGAKREGDMMASARGVAIKVKSQRPQGKMVVFTAAQDDETAFPFKEQKHGMFTYYLLRKLKESHGETTLGELGDYLQAEVRRQSFIENSKMQSPTITPSSSMQNTWRDLRLARAK